VEQVGVAVRLWFWGFYKLWGEEKKERKGKGKEKRKEKEIRRILVNKLLKIKCKFTPSELSITFQRSDPSPIFVEAV
jgi:hypothetical protein